MWLQFSTFSWYKWQSFNFASNMFQYSCIGAVYFWKNAKWQHETNYSTNINIVRVTWPPSCAPMVMVTQILLKPSLITSPLLFLKLCSYKPLAVNKIKSQDNEVNNDQFQVHISAPFSNYFSSFIRRDNWCKLKYYVLVAMENTTLCSQVSIPRVPLIFILFQKKIINFC
jgi:hypothetical protein